MVKGETVSEKKAAKNVAKKNAPAKPTKVRLSDMPTYGSLKAVVDAVGAGTLDKRGLRVELTKDKAVVRKVIGKGSTILFDGDRPKSNAHLDVLKNYGVRVSDLTASV